MKKITIILIAIICCVINNQAEAQKKIKPPRVRFGKIDKKWLAMKVYPKDSSASAVVLYDKGITEFDFDDGQFDIVYTRHTRIKILSKEGYKWANLSIPYYYPNSKNGEVVSGIRGITYNLVGKKVVKKILNRQLIAKQKINDNWRQKKVTLPDVKVGSVIDYTYTIKSSNYVTLRSWEFQTSIPVVWSQYEAQIPTFFRYRTSMSGFLVNLALTRTKTTQKTIQQRYNAGSDATRSTGTNSEFGRNATGSLGKTQSQTIKIKDQLWAAKDLPALKEEEYITTLDDYIPRLNFQLYLIQFPGSSPQPFYTNWATTNTQLLNHINFGDRFKATRFLDKMAKKIQAKHKDTTQQILAAYKHIQRRMTWNKKKRLFVRQPLEKLYASGKGNATAINMLFISLLRRMGIKAYPVVLGTRSHGKITPSSLPFLDKLNYTIALVQLNSKTTVLADASDKLLPIGTLPYHCLNGLGRVVNANGGNWVRLANPAANTQVNIEVNLGEEDGGTAKASVVQKGFAGFYERKDLAKKQALKYANSFWKGSDYTMVSHEFKEKRNAYKPLTASYSLKLKDDSKVTRAGNMIYVSPMLTSFFDKNPFKEETRQFPVDFGYTFQRNYFFSINVPKGYQVKSLPKQKVLTMAGKGGRLIYVAKQQGDKVQVIIRFSLKKSIFAQTEYPHLREFYAQVFAKVQEQIVLQKQ